MIEGSGTDLAIISSSPEKSNPFLMTEKLVKLARETSSSKGNESDVSNEELLSTVPRLSIRFVSSVVTLLLVR